MRRHSFRLLLSAGIFALTLIAIQSELLKYYRQPVSEDERRGEFTQKAVARVIEAREPMVDITMTGEGLPENPLRGSNALKLQLVGMEILTGEMAGRCAVQEHILHFNPMNNVLVRRGDWVSVLVTWTRDGISDCSITFPEIRFHRILLLAAAVVALLILWAGEIGFRGMATVAVIGAVLWWLFIPCVWSGVGVMTVTVLSAGCAAAAIFLLLPNKALLKGACVLGGSVGGLCVAAALLFTAMKLSGCTGLVSTYARILKQWEASGVSLEGIVAAGTVVCILGLTLDVSIGVASSVEQICAARSDVRWREAFHAGMDVGRDIMPTMVLTLVLAELGARLPALMFPRVANAPAGEVLMSEAALVEVYRVLCGGVGMMVSAPLTALIAGVLLPGRRFEERRVLSPSLGKLAHLVGVGLLLGMVSICIAQRMRLRATRFDERSFIEQVRQEKSLEALHEIARKEIRRRDYNRAVFALWRCEERFPEDGEARKLLGYVYAQRSWYVEAWHELRDATKLLPGDSYAHCYLGVVEAWLGMTDEALRELELAVLLDPANDEARTALQQLRGAEE